MELTVYTVSGAPRGWRVLLALAMKGLSYDIKYLSAADREHKSETYLNINPRGTLPSLRADAQTLTDSLGILAWLDKAFPERPIFGHTQEEVAEIWCATCDAADYLRAAQNKLFAPIFFDGLREPTPELEAAAKEFHAELKILQDRLDRFKYLASDYPSAVDAVCYPELRIAKRACDLHPALMKSLGLDGSFTTYPILQNWMANIENIDGFSKTMPVHWD